MHTHPSAQQPTALCRHFAKWDVCSRCNLDVVRRGHIALPPKCRHDERGDEVLSEALHRDLTPRNERTNPHKHDEREAAGTIHELNHGAVYLVSCQKYALIFHRAYQHDDAHASSSKKLFNRKTPSLLARLSTSALLFSDPSMTRHTINPMLKAAKTVKATMK